MCEVIFESNPKARKDHNCDACVFINESWGYVDFSFSELRLIVKARRSNYKIKKGQYYTKQVNKFDGEIYTFKAIPEMHKICINHDLYF